MISWRDEAILLATRPLGETSVIAELLTPERGRYAGVVRGGTSRKLAPILQPGAQVDATWSARLDQHLGSLTLEPQRSRAAQVMGNRMALAGLNAVTGLLAQSLPEREAHPALYDRTQKLLDLLGQNSLWPLAYLNWELALLEELGFGLDLTRCAVTGSTEDLVFVSPKSGRAVCAGAAGEWADRLLPLPPVLRGEGDAAEAEIAKALSTTGYFVVHRLVQPLGDRPVTPARQRFIDLLTRTHPA